MNNLKLKEFIKFNKNENLKLEGNFDKDQMWFLLQDVLDLLKISQKRFIDKLNQIIKDNLIQEKKAVLKIDDNSSMTSSNQQLFISMDAIIQVSFLLNTKNSTKLRTWALKSLQKYLAKGYILDEKELKIKREELQNVFQVLRKHASLPVLDGRESEVLALIQDYASTWNIFHHWDQETLSYDQLHDNIKYRLTHEDVRFAIQKLKADLKTKKEAYEIFGQETGGGISTVINTVNQSIGGNDLYPSIEEKAAHILYLTIKDHPFVDGNKRIASMLFILFLRKNNFIWKVNKEQKINDNALIALALLVANSSPKDKDIIIKLIIRILQNDYVE